MNSYTPNQIKEYYIAYFDILGYQQFFYESPEKAPEFLNTIHSVISNTKQYLQSVNGSLLASQYVKLHIQSKIFSDNILLCIEVGENPLIEQPRILSFMSIIAEIQRRFIIQYGLFLRGGLTKGKMSINDDYIFGEGLIEVVNMEESTVHPRIAVSNHIISILNQNLLYTPKEFDRAVSIENKMKAGENISDEDNVFYMRILQLNNQNSLDRYLAQNLLYKCDDGVICLSYLYCCDIHSFISEQSLGQVLEIMKQISPTDYEKLPKKIINVDTILEKHKHIVEQKLIKYSDYVSFATEDIRRFDGQERVLKKYVWSMVYHNKMCECYNKPELKIYSQGNCESRHMKLVIHVLDKDGKIINT